VNLIKMKNPIDVYYNGKLVTNFQMKNLTNGGRLEVKANPPAEWKRKFTGANYEGVSLSAFGIPVDQYKTPEQATSELMRNMGKILDMGSFPSLIHHKQPSLGIELKTGFVYDILAMGKRKSSRVIEPVAIVKYLCGEYRDPLVCHNTLEEAKFLVIQHEGLEPGEMFGTPGVLLPTSRIIRETGLIVAGFEFNPALPKIRGMA
jgi:hypothetical protein